MAIAVIMRMTCNHLKLGKNAAAAATDAIAIPCFSAFVSVWRDGRDYDHDDDEDKDDGADGDDDDDNGQQWTTLDHRNCNSLLHLLNKSVR